MINIWQVKKMSRHDEKQYCPLLKRSIFWGMCYEVQEVREDNMGIEHLGENIDLEEAHKTCEACRWYCVTDN